MTIFQKLTTLLSLGDVNAAGIANGQGLFWNSTTKKFEPASGASGNDADAIHDNIAGEIAAMTEKTTPVNADLIVIEDSADSNNKKKVQVGNLPGGGGGGVTDHGALSGLTDDDHSQYALADGSRGSFATTAQGALADSATQPADLAAGLATKANSSHTHDHSEITDYDTELAGKSNTTAFTPTGDYEPATKKYVDDEITGAGGYNDESAQDAVGGILVDSTEIDFTYDDATPSITASLKDGSIDEARLDTSVNASLDLADTAVQPGDNISGLVNDSGFQTSAQVTAAIDAVVDSAPGALDTLNELAASLGDDANFAATMTTSLAGKSNTGHTHTKSEITDFSDGDYATAAQGTLADSAVQPNNPTFTGELTYEHAKGAVSVLGNLGASQSFDWATATHFSGNLDSNATLTNANEASGQNVTLYLSYSGAQRTITWSDVDVWLDNSDGSAPVAPITTGDVLIVNLQYIGSTCYASATGNYAIY